MVPRFWYGWLQVAVVGVMLFGLGMVLTPGLIRDAFSLLLYADAGHVEAGFSEGARAYITLLHGVLGAVMFGWGLAMWFVLRGPFRDGQRIGWLLLAVPFVAWYLVDTAFSLYTGFWQNAVLNTGMFLVFAVPLGVVRKSFF